MTAVADPAPSTTQPEPADLVFAVNVIAALVVFRLLDTGIAHLSVVQEVDYARQSFIGAIGTHVTRLVMALGWIGGVMAAAMVLAGITVVVRRRRRAGSGFASTIDQCTHVARGGWRCLELGSAVRLFVLGATAIPAWVLSCYPRNLYFDQAHALERTLIVGLWLAIAWHPAFVVPFALLASAIAGQFLVPLGYVSMTEIDLLLRLPVMFGACWTLRVVMPDRWRSRTADVFVFTWCCMIATTYWTSGIGKLRVGWWSHGNVTFLTLGAYTNGWMSMVGAGAAVRLATALGAAAWPFQALTLLLECGSVLLLWRRWSLVAFILGATVFHAAVTVLTGIAFWKWIAVDLLLLVCLMRGLRTVMARLVTRGKFALSVVVIAAAPLWIEAANVTWLDTPLFYTLRLDAVDDSGHTHVLPAGFFRPYSDAFVLGTFAGISYAPVLTGAMGSSQDPRIADALRAVRSVDEVVAVERALGRTQYDSAAAGAFDRVVARYAERSTCDARGKGVIRWLSSPRHLFTQPLDASLPCNARIREVRVQQRTTLFDGDGLRLLRERTLRTIPISAQRGGAR